MKLPPTLLIVSSEIEPSAEDAWNDWYNNVHLPEIGECPGFLSAQRYVATDNDGTRHYVAIYALAGPEATQSEQFFQRRGWGPYGELVQYKTRLFTRIHALV